MNFLRSFILAQRTSLEGMCNTFASLFCHHSLSPSNEYRNFGPRTKAAVCEFQKAYTLTPDGIVGEDTKATLWMALSCQAPPGCEKVDKGTWSDSLPDEWYIILSQ